MSDYTLPTNDRELKEVNAQIMADIERLSGDDSTFYQRYLMFSLIETNKEYVESLTWQTPDYDFSENASMYIKSKVSEIMQPRK